MSILRDLLSTLLGLIFVVLGSRSLLGRRKVGRGSWGQSWQTHGWLQILFGAFWLLVFAPGLAGIHGWPRVWIALAGGLCAAGALAVILWDNWTEWKSLRGR